jgi:hypothetical protein
LAKPTQPQKNTRNELAVVTAAANILLVLFWIGLVAGFLDFSVGGQPENPHEMTL